MKKIFFRRDVNVTIPGIGPNEPFIFGISESVVSEFVKDLSIFYTATSVIADDFSDDSCFYNSINESFDSVEKQMKSILDFLLPEDVDFIEQNTFPMHNHSGKKWDLREVDSSPMMLLDKHETYKFYATLLSCYRLMREVSNFGYIQEILKRLTSEIKKLIHLLWSYHARFQNLHKEKKRPGTKNQAVFDLKKRVQFYFAMPLGKEQEKVISELIDYYYDNTQKIFILSGSAGTGKSALISAFIKAILEIDKNVYLMASTGRAAILLSQKISLPVETVHHRIYSIEEIVETGPKFSLKANPDRNCIYVVDESSMIQAVGDEKLNKQKKYLLDDLLSYIGPHNKLLLVGDPCQLPPVGENSPIPLAMINKTYLDKGIQVSSASLSKVFRQDESGLLNFAQKVRTEIKLENALPDLRSFENGKDIQLTSFQTFRKDLLRAYDEFGLNDCVVLSGSNQNVFELNRLIRNEFLAIKKDVICGDDLLVVENSYNWAPNSALIANGQLTKVISLGEKCKVGDYGFVQAEMQYFLPGFGDVTSPGIAHLNLLNNAQRSLTQKEKSILFQCRIKEYIGYSLAEQQILLRKDPYINALQVKYSYAMTVHKSQGGQWPCVFIDLRSYYRNKNLNWLYTAITRAKSRVFLIN
ncbi:MAG: hypothetical protein CL609_22935 [Anaerolineaceae bacterium]|nr:hypothetical protein [Anaerolineaceae bacterium]